MIATVNNFVTALHYTVIEYNYGQSNKKQIS